MAIAHGFRRSRDFNVHHTAKSNSRCASSLSPFMVQLGRFVPWDEHRDAFLVLAVLVTKLRGRTALLEKEATEEGGGGAGCKKEMPAGNAGRSQEGDDK